MALSDIILLYKVSLTPLLSFSLPLSLPTLPYTHVYTQYTHREKGEDIEKKASQICRSQIKNALGLLLAS